MTHAALDWPLMHDNITREDLDAVIDFLRGLPILTQSTQVREFEREFAAWLGARHAVFLNSGSSANFVTMAALRELRGPGEVIVPPLTWVSDIASVLHAGFEPVFADIDPRTLGLEPHAVLARLTPRTRAVFLTHILGYNALDDALLAELAQRGVPLIEDTCESYGATFHGRKLGTFGWAANFSFYYAHHMSTIEGGMVTTDDPDLHEAVRMLRAHGLVREAASPDLKEAYRTRHPDLSPDFIFAYPGFNMRQNEIAAVIGRSQLRRLDANNRTRTENLSLFLSRLDPARYRTDFATEGSCNYAFTLVLRHPDERLAEAVMKLLRESGVEFRRGLSGGGNQLRQPYLKRLVGDEAAARYPVVEHVHFFGFYLGNYPGLERWKIEALCDRLNAVPAAG